MVRGQSSGLTSPPGIHQRFLFHQTKITPAFYIHPTHYLLTQRVHRQFAPLKNDNPLSFFLTLRTHPLMFHLYYCPLPTILFPTNALPPLTRYDIPTQKKRLKGFGIAFGDQASRSGSLRFKDRVSISLSFTLNPLCLIILALSDLAFAESLTPP